mmetsp:Transcript_18654/g.22896  ORF Transcript_18654/g.22896 Transcript_18654/m.22896 type:complete len:141 (+) Transcript_18654:438-860(+)
MTLVEADEDDFLLPDPKISGYLARSILKVEPGTVTEEGMKRISKRKSTFEIFFFELKGNTLFYRSFKEQKENLYNITYKLNLSDVQFATFNETEQEIVLNVQMHEHLVRLRRPKEFPVTEDCLSLNRWYSALRELRIQFV